MYKVGRRLHQLQSLTQTDKAGVVLQYGSLHPSTYTLPTTPSNMMWTPNPGRGFMWNKLLTCIIVSLSQACVHMHNSCRICQILPRKLSSCSPLNTPLSIYVYLYVFQVFSKLGWKLVKLTFGKTSTARGWECSASVISRGILSDIQMAGGCCQLWVLFLKIRTKSCIFLVWE